MAFLKFGWVYNIHKSSGVPLITDARTTVNRPPAKDPRNEPPTPTPTPLLPRQEEAGTQTDLLNVNTQVSERLISE